MVWLCVCAVVQVKWFSPFLLAVYDRHSETFQSLCRCMSGFTDDFYAAAKERLSASIIPGPKPYYNTGESPSVWFEPTEVSDAAIGTVCIPQAVVVSDHEAECGRRQAGRLFCSAGHAACMSHCQHITGSGARQYFFHQRLVRLTALLVCCTSGVGGAWC